MMNVQFAEREEIAVESENSNDIERSLSAETISSVENESELITTDKPKFTRKKIVVLGAVIAIAAIASIAAVLFIPSKLVRVRNECDDMISAESVSGDDDYFTLDTYPDRFEKSDIFTEALFLASGDEIREDTLKAIAYANKELGFNRSVYSRMLETTALMGRQSEENGKYKVSWTYHPDDGLEVTYEKK